jgi:hypothetical protein
MKKNLPLSQEQIDLPKLDSIEKTDLAFSDAFLKAAQILKEHLQTIKSSLEKILDFKKEEFNLAIVGLFSKICRCYYSYVLLEINHDRNGSQFLLEHLYESAITLIYLIEEFEPSLFSDYTSASLSQARFLLSEVEAQLQYFPRHPELIMLRDKLNIFIVSFQQQNIELTPYASKAYLWGSNEANTTAKRGSILGLSFLTNPARQIALRVMPASWLDLQLNYLNSSTEISTKQQPGTNFRYLRDTTHLCLFAAQALLEEVIGCQEIELSEIKHQKEFLNVLYEWFHNAYIAYHKNVVEQ